MASLKKCDSYIYRRTTRREKARKKHNNLLVNVCSIVDNCVIQTTTCVIGIEQLCTVSVQHNSDYGIG